MCNWLLYLKLLELFFERQNKKYSVVGIFMIIRSKLDGSCEIEVVNMYKLSCHKLLMFFLQFCTYVVFKIMQQRFIIWAVDSGIALIKTNNFNTSWIWEYSNTTLFADWTSFVSLRRGHQLQNRLHYSWTTRHHIWHIT